MRKSTLSGWICSRLTSSSPGGDEVAHAHPAQARHGVERGQERELRQPRLGEVDRGRGRALLRLSLVQRPLGPGIAAPEFARPLEVGRGELELGLGLDQLCLLDQGIELDHHLPGLDRTALLEIDRGDAAGHLGLEQHQLVRAQRAHGLGRDLGRGNLHLGGLDRHRAAIGTTPADGGGCSLAAGDHDELPVGTSSTGAHQQDDQDRNETAQQLPLRGRARIRSTT